MGLGLTSLGAQLDDIEFGGDHTGPVAEPRAGIALIDLFAGRYVHVTYRLI